MQGLLLANGPAVDWSPPPPLVGGSPQFNTWLEPP